jgi:NitT/TauT family transport system substrate-binding protein
MKRFDQIVRHGRRALALGAGIAVLTAGATGAMALEKLPFTLNWKIGGGHAPFFVAVENGYFAEVGLEPEYAPGDGSANVVNRLASKTWEIGTGDIASVIKFNALNPDKRVLAIYNVTLADLAVVTLKGRGIEKPADLKGKKIGAPPGDTAYKMWPAYAKANGFGADDVTWEHMAAKIREAMLMQGRVDAITANEGTAYFNMKGAGVPDSDMIFLRYADSGVKLVNIGLMVNADYAKANPVMVRKVVGAIHKGFVACIKDPDAAIKVLMKVDPLLNPDIERQRLDYTVKRMTTQPDTLANGLGWFSDETIRGSIDIVLSAEEIKGKVAPADVVDMSFLPPKEERMVPPTGS